MMANLPELDDDTTVLTVNNRLAVELRARYDRQQAAVGRTVWPSADILPWGAWLGRQYDQLLDIGFTDRDLLTADQESIVWEGVITRHADSEQLMRPQAAADIARDAFALCQDWQLDETRIAATAGSDTRTFLAWRSVFEQQLERHRFLTAAQLPALIRDAIEAGKLHLPQKLVYSGFDSLAPQQQTLFDALTRRGTKVQAHEPLHGSAERRRISAVDGEHEIRLAARWAAHKIRDMPAARIGIVSPRITEQRDMLQRLFSEVVTPLAYLGESGEQAAFNLSLGESLATYPLAAHALLALRLLAGGLPLSDIGQLLRSPFLGGHAGEWENRALLDAALREDGLPQIDLFRLMHRMRHFDTTDLRHCPDLIARLEQMREARSVLPTRASPALWVGHLKNMLQILGWPGDSSLDSREYQQYERLISVLSELAGLGKVQRQMRVGEVLSRLTRLTSDTVFQAKSPPTPIQILGGLEAAGMDFDAIWLMDMNDQIWPAAAKPNPLLPADLQRELDMPHASAERELAFASALTERLAGSANEIIASHACVEADRELRPSPLIRDWPEITASDLVAADSCDLRTACREVSHWQTMPAPRASAATAGIRGGAALLAAQANCPFSAVARYRLQARPLDEPSFAPDGALSGTLVHELLQRVWQSLRNSAALGAHDDAALQALIHPLAEATLQDIGRRRPDIFSARFRQLEADRLTTLVLNWLDAERQRSQPFEVVAMEQDQVVRLAALQLKTRADRVDRLADGSLAIIDYKTGRSVRNDGWFDERLTEPQLPLYCLQAEGDVSATLLARVRRDKPGCTFVGLSRDADFGPGIVTPQSRFEDTDWSRLLQHWRQAIGALAEEISDGDAEATPSDQACQYCALGGLCRVQQRMTEASDD